MRQKLKMPLVAACLCLAGAGTANAQWVVSDPTNLAQSIINSAKEMVETAGTKANTLNGLPTRSTASWKPRKCLSRERSITTR